MLNFIITIIEGRFALFCQFCDNMFDFITTSECNEQHLPFKGDILILNLYMEFPYSFVICIIKLWTINKTYSMLFLLQGLLQCACLCENNKCNDIFITCFNVRKKIWSFVSALKTWLSDTLENIDQFPYWKLHFK